MQTTLTRILIVLESVSHGLSENSDEISRKALKFKGFFRPKTGGLRKKKRSSPKLSPIRNSKVFSVQKQVVSKKKRSSPKLRLIFRPKSEIQRFQEFKGGCFLMGGGLFSIFHKKSASKALKTCDFEYFTSQWGGARAPRPPPGYATAHDPFWGRTLSTAWPRT